MPSTSERTQICQGGGFDGGIVTSGWDQAECRRQGGEPVPRPPDAGGPSHAWAPGERPPVWASGILLQPHLAEPFWDATQTTDRLTAFDAAERLVLHPLCTLHRRLGPDTIVGDFDRLNQRFAEPIGKAVADDPDLASTGLRFLLDIASIATSALDFESTGDLTAEITAEFVGDAAVLGRTIADASGDDALREAIEALVARGESLIGVRAADLVDALGSDATAT